MYLKDIRTIIHQVLTDIGLWSKEAEALILGTGAVETHYNRIIQMGNGPARSWWQIEPLTAMDICSNYLRYRIQLLDKIADACLIGSYHLANPTLDNMKLLLERNIAFAIAMCRLKYRRVKAPLPPAGDVTMMAQYWKKHYNTLKGKGTVEKFIDAWVSDVG